MDSALGTSRPNLVETTAGADEVLVRQLQTLVPLQTADLKSTASMATHDASPTS